MKFCVLVIVFLWFISSASWWRYSLLSPIIIYVYQIWETHQDTQYLDSYGNLNAFPAILSVILILILISNLLRYRYGILDIYESVEDELESIVEYIAKRRLGLIK